MKVFTFDFVAKSKLTTGTKLRRIRISRVLSRLMPKEATSGELWPTKQETKIKIVEDLSCKIC